MAEKHDKLDRHIVTSSYRNLLYTGLSKVGSSRPVACLSRLFLNSRRLRGPYPGLYLCLDFLWRPVRNLSNFTTVPHLASTALTLDPRRHADIGIPHEPPEHVNPTVMSRKRIVEFSSDLAKFGKTRPRHGREIVVLVVIANVVGHDVERTVITIGLGNGNLIVWIRCFRSDGLVNVVLGNEVTSRGVEGSGEEGRQEEVKKRLPRAQSREEDVIKSDLDNKVEEMHPGEGHLEHTHRPNSVEEDLEGAEECFAKDGVKDNGLDSGGKIGVEAVYA